MVTEKYSGNFSELAHGYVSVSCLAVSANAEQRVIDKQNDNCSNNGD